MYYCKWKPIKLYTYILKKNKKKEHIFALNLTDGSQLPWPLILQLSVF